jgi:hypothetical protein
MIPKNRQLIYLSHNQMRLVFNEAEFVYDMNMKFGLSYSRCISKNKYEFIIVNVKQYMIAKIKYGI